MSKCLLTGWARRVKWKKIRQLRSYEHRNFLIALMIANIFDITSGFLLDILGDSNAKEGALDVLKLRDLDKGCLNVAKGWPCES